MLRRLFRQRRVRLFLAAAVLVLGGVAARLSWAEYHFRAAERDLERRAFPSAHEHLAKYLHVWPRSRTGHLLAARAARRAGDLAEAERHLAACAGVRGADLAALALEEHLLDAQRGVLTPDAEAFLWERVRQGHPQGADVLHAMACGYLYTYRLGEALRCLDACLERWPGDVPALSLRGQVWQGLNRLDRAEKDFRAALERDPEDAEARRLLAEALFSDRQPRRAAEQYEWLHHHDPEDVGAMLGLAACRQRTGDVAEARRLLDTVLAREPGNVMALRERGALAQAGDEPDADRWYRQALEHDPSDLEACYALGQYLIGHGRKEEGRKYLDRHAAIERDLATLRDLLARIGKAPGDADLRCEAARICRRNGQREEARRWLLGALRIDPRHAGARQALEDLSAPSKESSGTQ
jgi:predicted Zn-dependent protease